MRGSHASGGAAVHTAVLTLAWTGGCWGQSMRPPPSSLTTDAAAHPHRCGTCAGGKASKLTGQSV